MTRRKRGGERAGAKPAGGAARARATRPATSAAARLPAPDAARVESARRKFETGVVRRGEAVPKGRPLPPGATHEVVGRRADGRPALKRRRFSIRPTGGDA